MPIPYSITYSIEDEHGYDSKFVIYVPSAWSIEDVFAYSQAFAIILDPLILGKISNIAVAINVLPVGCKVSALQNSDVEEKMMIALSYAPNGRAELSYNIPTFNEAFTTLLVRGKNGERILDLLQDEPLALLNFQTSATLAGYPSNICGRRGDVISVTKKTKFKYSPRRRYVGR